MLFNRKGDTGISTLIIFIAMILVAAIAALVIIQAVSGLQSQGTATAQAARRQVSTLMRVDTVVGYVYSSDGPDKNIAFIRITGELAAGSQGIDLNDLILSYTTSSDVKTATWLDSISSDNADTTFTNKMLLTVTNPGTAGNPPEDKYDVRYVKHDATYSSAKIERNEKVEIWYNNPDTAPLTSVSVTIEPTGGTSTPIQYQVPPTLTGTWVPLFPA